jgi:hypothetical protein
MQGAAPPTYLSAHAGQLLLLLLLDHAIALQLLHLLLQLLNQALHLLLLILQLLALLRMQRSYGSLCCC